MNFESKSLSPEGVKSETIENYEAIDFIFSQYPELSQIGNQESYKEYISTIFPDSKFQEIVFHSSNVDFLDEGFKPMKPNFDTVNSIEGVYNFSSNRKFTSKHYGSNTYAVKLNIQNPIEESNSGIYADDMDRPLSEALIKMGKTNHDFGPSQDNSLEDKDSFINNLRGENYMEVHPKTGIEYGIPPQKIVTVFDTKQIHILGSKKDIEGFSDFIEQQI